MNVETNATHQDNRPSKAGGFHPLIYRKGEDFCVYLPEWKVSGVGASLDEAYIQYERNLEMVRDRSAEFGLGDLSPEPNPIFKRREVLHELSLFFLKVASTAFIVILTVVLLLPNISAAFRHNLQAIWSAEMKDPKYWALQVPEKLNAKLDRLSPEEEEKIRNEWGRLTGRILPIFSASTCQTDVESHLIESN